ncbi:MAG: beta galactosidase jelly roll domain-containing protein [Proteobacteria bacterium]|nr:beta galactosidase jelly roll domain-containing protein [Pseudomonadota bacterium]
MKSLFASFLACIAAFAARDAVAVELPRVFSDGMVLQRGQAIPVWGRSAPGAKVTVRFDGRTRRGTADAHGDWRIRLPAHVAGGPYALRIDDGKDVLVLSDVLVGEVWLASGQSNMELPLSQTDGAQAEIAGANDALIREFKIPKSWAGMPQWQLQGGDWKSASPATAGNFSAVAYYFAKELRRKTGVPVGIIDSTWGGSSIQAWTDAATQGLNDDAVGKQAAALNEADQREMAVTQQSLAHWPHLPMSDAGWQATALDMADWADIAVPGNWETRGYNGMDGVAWYRTTFTLSADEAKAGIVLGVGRIDDSDITWVNGVQVGQTSMQYDTPRVYPVPASALHAGENAIAVRVTDVGGGGGIHGDANALFVQPKVGARRPLASTWKFHPANVTVSLVDNKNQIPTLLYNAMIHPLQSYALRGVIWYQGEANANSAQDALRYRQQFPAMIAEWRMQWQAPKLPFMWVQLASYGSGMDRGGVSPWALLRESQSATLRLPATAQAVIIDIGNSRDIHPRNKRDVGLRLALAAQHVAYGETLDYHGPVFKDMHVEQRRAILSFDIGARWLAVRGGDALKGFQLAGADQVFHEADASIEGGRIVVQSVAVPAPVAVRYGWNDDPGMANLINSAGLPASPFRSDAW